VPSGPAGLWDVLRVEAGRPAWGAELGERTLAADAGLVPDVVRLDEGLYPGLQVALRQDRSGTVHRAVRLLRLASPVRAGDEVRGADGRRLGVVGTAVVSPRRGPLALALLRRSAEPGSRVDVGDVSGVVVAAPR
jgi:glycine cleavage system aminomethyltransferase T